MTDIDWLAYSFDSTVLTWIQQTASSRILTIARKFLKTQIGRELMLQPANVTGSGGRLYRDFIDYAKVPHLLSQYTESFQISP